MPCEHCLKEISRGKAYVTGEGPDNPYYMLLGEAPGAEEDKTSRPFVGDAGRYLSSVLREDLGIDRRELYIDNAIRTRPDNNRTPKMHELRTCREGCLIPTIRERPPKCIICLGLSSWKSLTDDGQASLAKNRRRVEVYMGIPFVCTYHPAAVLRNPYLEDYFVADLEAYLIDNQWDRKPFKVEYEII